MNTAAPSPSPFRRASWVALGGVWLLALVVGMGGMLAYQTTPDAVGPESVDWPIGTAIPRPSGRPTLLVFAHPRCPCTRATLDELARILGESKGEVDASVWFLAPSSLDRSWAESDLWRQAGAIPGVTVHADVDGAEADRFGARTSGHVAVYGPTGALLFGGGITGMRGEPGDNPGASAVTALLAGPATDLPRGSFAVFGCPLSDAPADGTATADSSRSDDPPGPATERPDLPWRPRG